MKEKCTPVTALVAALPVSLVLAAACHLDALVGSNRGVQGGLDSLAQLESDSVTTIPPGGSTPDPTIVVRAVVRDTTGAGTVRLEVELRPVGTGFLDQATDSSDPTPSGGRAYVRVSGLADNTGYHWQARAVDQSGPIGTWRTYGGNPESAADVHFDVVATHLAFTSPPATTTAGATLPPVQVALVDAQNNTVTTFTGTITLTLLNAGGAVLGGSTDMSAVSGVATFSDLSITQAGSGYRLEATSDTLSGVTSGSFAINPGPADHLVFLVEPSNTRPNQAITPAVRVAVHDVYSNVVTSFTDVMFMNIGNDGSLLKNATLDPAGTHRAASAGIATFEDLRIDQLGSGYTLAVSAAGTRGATSGRFDVTLTP